MATTRADPSSTFDFQKPTLLNGDHQQSPQLPLFNPYSPNFNDEFSHSSLHDNPSSPERSHSFNSDDGAAASSQSHVTASTSKTSSAAPSPPTNMICASCQLPLTGQFVKAMNAVYHLDCFRCGDCNTVVAQKFFPIEGPDGKQHPLCETDYFRRLNLICAKCGLALRGSYITACNKKFHVEHFTCSVCPTVFGQQDSYYEHEDNVYCHFHYSTRFATKCVGCNSAILKQFVEINRNMKDECWHPECYMIHKFWNVKVRPSSLSPSQTNLEHPPYTEEEEKDTPSSLKEKQGKMEQQVYRIWTVLSAFEESSAACISDMLRQVSNGQYLEAIRMAEKFILHVEVLFATIDDLEAHFAQRHVKGMSHVREARMLCRKTVDLFTLLSKPQEAESRRIGMTQELLALVTGLAHYLKILIRIALTGGLKLEREHSDESAMVGLLDKLHTLVIRGGDPTTRRLIKGSTEVSSNANGMTGTQGVSYGYRSLAPENTGDSPFWSRDATSQAGPSKVSSPNPPSDLCLACNQTVEEDCVRLGTYQRWHSYCVKCQSCGKLAAPPLAPREPSKVGTEEDAPMKVSTTRKGPANVSEFLYEEIPGQKRSTILICCTSHITAGAKGGFLPVTRLEQYAFLLNVALRRLYVLLKQKGVIQLTHDSNRASQVSLAFSESSDLLSVKSVHLDRKLSATARLPQRSTIVESPSGRTAHPAQLPQYPQVSHHQKTAGGDSTGRPPRSAPPPIVQSAQMPPKPVLQPPPPIRVPQESPQSSPSSNGEHVLRPDFARNNTRVKIIDEASPTPYSRSEQTLSRVSDDTLTLADIPQLVEAEQAREQKRSMPRQTDRPLIADLSTLELALVKHCAVWALSRSPLRDQFELDELLELVEIKKSGFWKQLFKGDKNKNVKKKGVFGVPIELLVEKDGFDSTLGISRTPLRIPSFIDDVISAMRQMDMSVEGIFRKNGNIRGLKDLSDNLDRDQSNVDLTSENPVQLAALLKKFLRELPEPLFTFKLHRLFTASPTGSQDPHERLRLLHMVSIILPKCNLDTLQVLCVFLKWVASFAHVDETGNKMDLQNLSTVLAPNVLYAKSRDPIREESFGSIRVLTDYLENQDELYQVPEEFMDLLRDQNFFEGALDLPGKDLLKKIDTYMKLRSSGRGPSGLMSPIANGMHSPFHPSGPMFSPGQSNSNASTAKNTPRAEDTEIRLVPQRSDPVLSRGRTTVSEGHQRHQAARYRAPDSRSLERGEGPPSPRYQQQTNKISSQQSGLQQQPPYGVGFGTAASLNPLSPDFLGQPPPPRSRIETDIPMGPPPPREATPRGSGEYYSYSPSSEHAANGTRQ